MAETTLVGERIDIVETGDATWLGHWSAVTWSAVIAGALTAIAVSFIIISLGSGIGFVLASPFSSSPSAGTLTVLGAVWLVFAQAIGFATGGYVAGRCRHDPAPAHSGEIKFRDGANGLVVWAIGVVVTSILLAAAVEKVGSAAATSATASGAVAGLAGSQAQPLDYYTDMLLRPNPQAVQGANDAVTPVPEGSNGPAGANPTGGPAASTPAADNAMRSQLGRILIVAIGPNGLSNDDRTYLTQIVSARTGMSTQNAQKRVDDVVNQAKANAAQTADTARKAAAFLSFWTFMSLLFGAVCATLGGILGGELRDEFATVTTVPR